MINTDSIHAEKNNPEYTYLNGKLLREVDSNNNTIDFIYGVDGIMGINYNNAAYLFRKNVFGDVTHIYDTEGNLKARYIYDAWGNHKVVDVDENDPIGEINPIRYRSYYYDDEIGLYYLRARYYDPQTGRFISQDNINYLDPEHLSGLNLYAYCNDNPVMNADPIGCFVISISAIIIGAAIGAIVGLGATAYRDYKEDGVLFNGNNWGYLFSGVTGAITGAISGLVAGASFGVQLGIAALMGATTNIVEGFYTGTITEFWSKETLIAAMSGASVSMVSFSLTSGIVKGASRIKYNSIIGGNTSNHHINQALSASGFSDVKIGRDGLKEVLKRISQSKSIVALEYGLSAFFDFFTGVFNL